MYMVFDPSTCFTFGSSLRLASGRGIRSLALAFPGDASYGCRLALGRAPAR